MQDVERAVPHLVPAEAEALLWPQGAVEHRGCDVAEQERVSELGRLVAPLGRADAAQRALVRLPDALADGGRGVQVFRLLVVGEDSRARWFSFGTNAHPCEQPRARLIESWRVPLGKYRPFSLNFLSNPGGEKASAPPHVRRGQPADCLESAPVLVHVPLPRLLDGVAAVGQDPDKLVPFVVVRVAHQRDERPPSAARPVCLHLVAAPAVGEVAAPSDGGPAGAVGAVLVFAHVDQQGGVKLREGAGHCGRDSEPLLPPEGDLHQAGAEVGCRFELAHDARMPRREVT